MNDFNSLSEFSDVLGPLSARSVALLVLLMTMLFATTIRLVRLKLRPSKNARARLASLGTWWVLAIGLALAVLFDLLGVCLLMAAASWLAWVEYRRLLGVEPSDRAAAGLLFAAIPIAYGAVLIGDGEPVLAFLPLGILVVVAAGQIVAGATESYLRSVGGWVLGAIALLVGLGYAAQLAALPGTDGSPLAGVGWFLYLVLLTAGNDISQALVGRKLGRHKITPRVSPNKTWEGFLGGVVVTVLLANLLAPLLTTLRTGELPLPVPPLADSLFWPTVAGLVIALSGFLGDLNISAIKRNVGVKDSGNLLPGMGGMVDRVDSLTLTAPGFYYLVALPAL